MLGLYRDHGLVAAIEDAGQRLFFAFGPKFNHQLLSDPETFHARFFAIRGPRHSAQRRLTGALLSMNGAEHKRHRRLVQAPFQKQAIETYCDALARLAEQLVRDWQVGEVRDIHADMTQYMLRVASSVLFGFDQAELAYEIGRRTEQWVSMNHELGIGAFVSDSAIAAEYNRLLELAEALEVRILAMIEHRRATGSPGNDVLSLLIRAHDDDGQGISDDELIGHAAILFGAAHMTTANTLSWTLFLLAQHPPVAEALCDELSRVLGGQPATVAQLERLELLDRVVKESMRVLPASFYSQRACTRETELGPFRLPKNAIVIFSQYITHHLPELFPEPEKFLPERWRGLSPSPYAYMPFAAGPRMCLGGPLALLTIKITLAVILQRRHFRLAPEATIDGKVISTMLTPATTMPMIIADTHAPFSRTPVAGNIHSMVDGIPEATPKANPAAYARG